MKDLKSMLLTLKSQDHKEEVLDRIKVVGLSIASCIKQAQEHWNTDLTQLDYDIIEKGKKSFFRIKPYRLEVRLLKDQVYRS